MPGGKHHARWVLLSLAILASGCVGPFVRNEKPARVEEHSAAPAAGTHAAAEIAIDTTGSAVEAASDAGGDLWARIAAGFRLEPRRNADIQRELHWFVQHPKFLERVSERAHPFLYHVVTEVQSRGMPTEVALLPIIESAYEARAYSPSHAAGMWQFMAGTARRFGLRVDGWYDGRRDAIASTRAALDYLQLLHDRFGDWELAFAAYNCGELAIDRARDRNAKRGRPIDFWSLELPAETRGFVPRLLAIAEVIRDPTTHRVRLRDIADAPAVIPVDALHQIDLREAALMAGIGLDDLRALNPAYLRSATPPDGPHALLVPLDKAAAFQIALAQRPENPPPPWVAHRVARGETLQSLAARHGVHAVDLREANGLKPGTRLHAGMRILVPAHGAPSSNAPATAAVAEAATAPDQGPARGERGTHTVRRGDNLWDIARKYGVKLDDLRRWNRLPGSPVLALGQKLIVAGDDGAEAAPARPVARARTGAGQQVYKVRMGDSLWSIARRFDVRVDDLRRWNALPRKAHLQPGQEIRIMVAVADDAFRI
ncbi:MAG: LysM peptidoglycan-binding domain-containing protein [Gammaproteobacteria bacterium]